MDQGADTDARDEFVPSGIFVLSDHTGAPLVLVTHVCIRSIMA
jgi:hypothetical protein